MHIEKILRQYRRDLIAVYTCEHCGFTFEGGGYDDTRFHNKVVPLMLCVECNRRADEEYIPMSPKYPDEMQI